MTVLAKKCATELKITMLHNYVLVLAITKEEHSGLIQLPEKSDQQKPTEGKVVSVGPGEFNPSANNITPMSVKEGDVVYYNQWAGREIELNGEKYIAMKESDIIARKAN